jgi:RES domain-containing protein
LPTGRLGGRWNRALVAVIYGYTLLLAVADAWMVERPSAAG